MPYIYGGNGFNYSYQDDGYVLLPGEQAFDGIQTEEQLQLAFPLRAGIQLSDAKARRLSELTAACHAAIAGNFVSSAQGSEKTYPSAPTDQSNLHTALLVGATGDVNWSFNLWCESGGTWALTPHSFTEIQQVLKDYSTSLQGFQSHWATLVAAINSAATIPDVLALNW